ncbi:molybdopterin oxidoreductase family protein [Cognatishimia activa]|uniref:Molybdopterin-dependent oxidoreductase n=1 Tax=Cognatishimia activa TaxID=1715691 RepID=A0A975ERI0_9RHOB|nr:molybdopterin oxidoreductase family protein [Cognatishimia activa]QTN36885.1 molybdopterin-dependent oxidoreductase [Cognatishimia activa]
MPFKQPDIDTSPKVSDEIRKTTCYMCACRCGINVHMKDGKVAYIEGNRDHPVNQGVLCAKGSAGIMQVNAPSRLRKPLKRVGPRGSGEYQEISWEEAMSTAVGWLTELHETAPHKLAFFTGRDQSQSFTSFWAQHFGTPNYAAHGGFCSVNMAAGGIYTMGGAFWEFGQPDWDHTKLFMLFGVAEDHDSNPIKMGIGKIKARGAKVIGVNPVRNGYNAVADEWVGITPGTDGLFILALVHELMKAGKIDLDYLAQFTNAPVLIDKDTGLFLRDDDGKPLVVDRVTGKLTPFDQKDVQPSLSATHEGHRTVMALMAEKYLDPKYAPEAVAEATGVSAKKIKTIAAELARVAFDEAIELDREWTDFRGNTHSKMTGRPVSMHAMRGISAHSNGFQTCRALHVLQILLGTVETPGGFRFKPPYPKPVEAHPTPHGDRRPGKALEGPHLGFPRGPEDLLLDSDGNPQRIDKAFSWENPMSAHGLMHMVISNAYAQDPYPIDTLFMYMANMSWNSSMNTSGVIEMLTARNDSGGYRIPRIIYSDAYSSEMVAYADLILPDTTYLERHDCISLLDRPICEADGAADAIRWPVIEPDRDVRGFQSVLIELGARIGLPAFMKEDGSPKWKDYADYIVNHERKPGIGPLSGWRGEDGDKTGRGAVNPDQMDAYVANGGFHIHHVPSEAAYYKPWNTAYQDWAVDLGLYDSPQPYLFQLYSEPMRKFQRAAEGHGDRVPPEHLRDRLKEVMDPLPIWYEPFEEQAVDTKEYPIHALTQRPMAMYHSWGTQNAWLRQLHGKNPLYVPQKLWDEHGFKEGDWARVTSTHGSITVPVALQAALNENTVWTWNAIGKRKGAWALSEDAPEAREGFLLNHLIHELLPPKGDGLRWANSDPITGQAAWFDLRVKIERVDAPAEAQPAMKPLKSPVEQGPDTLEWKVGK